MSKSGLEPDRRIKALQQAGYARHILERRRRQWILMATTRSAALDLVPVIAELGEVETILRDDDGNHWDLAPVLRSASQALADHSKAPELAIARDAVQAAYDAIVKTSERKEG